MSRSAGFPLPLQVLLWAACNTAAGASTGLIVGMFRQGGLEPTIIMISILFGNVVGFTVLISSLILFPRLRRLAPWARGALLGLALLSGSIAGTALVLYLFPLFVLHDLRPSLAVGAVNGVLALIVGSVVHAYEGMRWRLAESLREVEEVRLVEAQLKEEAARAELAALQARINPHFLFNTLNTISSLMAEDPERAEEMVQTLADLFRYTFKAADAGPVPLSEELEFIEGYLAIERARFGERLRVEWNIEPAARSLFVPGLLLQPLVENAVIHGLAPVSEGGTVRIVAKVDGEALQIEVADDGAGLQRPPEELVRAEHGLGNVRCRVTTFCRGDGFLEVLPSTRGRGTVARLRMSLRFLGAPAGPAEMGTAPFGGRPRDVAAV